MRVDEAPARWEVELTSGAVIEVWADSYTLTGGTYVFDIGVWASPAEQAGWVVTATRPTDPHRVLVAVARVPAEVVREVRSG